MHLAVAIIPCLDLDESQAFYELLGFTVRSNYESHGYRILEHAEGAQLHLTRALTGWVKPEQNAHGLYLYTADVEALAKQFGRSAEVKPWGLREFALSDPNGVLVRIGSFLS
ncbi:VOC family protein [Sphingomonas sp.]|jgi:catechol 2,3-dioxygenase-like lactoylglutathione lyase family enzyme|uniref:VOC family protein n=1 Tax=Sphingomonas sp. TaxID=28214 RepID=UPI002FC88CE8